MEFKNKRNPILPLKYHVPDCEAHVMPDGKLYIYGSYDNRTDGYCSEEYHVVSTPDMEHWNVHQISLKGEDVPWFFNPDAPKYQGIDWYHPTPFLMKMIEPMMKNPKKMEEAINAGGSKQTDPLLFAPDCIHKNGKYYLYFCMADNSEGVAVADRPEGPFTDLIQLPCGGIDPAIFIDDDGQAYYYWGQIFAHGVRLNEDMISFDKDEIADNLVTEQEHCFHEGSSMRKIGDTYYYVYADIERGKPTSLGYSVGKSPLGPFTYKGIIIDNDGCDPKSWNNHGSIECFHGQWYVFYHRCSRGTQQYRRLCIEPITVNPDGTIDEVKMTSQGIGDPFAPGEPIMGYQACGLKGSVFITENTGAASEEYPEKLANISAGDEIVFRYVKSETDWKAVRLRCAGRGQILVQMNGEEAGSFNITGNTNQLQTVEGKIHMPAGEYELTLKVPESSGLEIFEVRIC